MIEDQNQELGWSSWSRIEERRRDGTFLCLEDRGESIYNEFRVLKWVKYQTVAHNPN
jgi:hypothetical protein